MKIIIDTNLWISFLLGKSLSTLKFVLSDLRCTVYICDELVSEFKEVAARDKIRKYISEEDVISTLKLMDMHCTFVNQYPMTSADIRDINDLYLLSLADQISADYIITGDKDLLTLKEHGKTKIVSYKDFMENATIVPTFR